MSGYPSTSVIAARFPLGTLIAFLILCEALAAIVKNPLYNTPSPLASAIYSMFWAARMPFVLSFAVMTMTTGALKRKSGRLFSCFWP